MDITPAIPEERKVVEAYGNHQFRITGDVYTRPVLVFADRVVDWAVDSVGDMTVESLNSILDEAGRIDLLLVGCGTEMLPLDKEVRSTLRSAGIVMEPMNTGAACRTYNVLILEERHVAAALIPVA